MISTFIILTNMTTSIFAIETVISVLITTLSNTQRVSILFHACCFSGDQVNDFMHIEDDIPLQSIRHNVTIAVQLLIYVPSAELLQITISTAGPQKQQVEL
jgi:hypothetical protein